jgi:GT2 family glycosyltransferase
VEEHSTGTPDHAPAAVQAKRKPDRAPAAVQALAHARSQARAAKDWPEADRLRAEIESAGWKVVDHGVRFQLSRAHPPDITDGGMTRYGMSSSVPSRLDGPATDAVSVVLVATDLPDDLARTVAALASVAPSGSAIVVAANDPSPEQAETLIRLAADSGRALPMEVVWTSARLGQAAALNAAIRRATGRVVVLLDTSVEPTGDILTPLVHALDDPSVAVAGPFGVTSPDLRHFEDAQPGDVDAIEGDCMAFRRDDYAARGPLDERFRYDRHLDLWWSLVLRDEGPDAVPRRAVSITLPLARHPHRDRERLADAERDRLSRRNFYRIVDRFGRRPDLASGPGT